MTEQIPAEAVEAANDVLVPALIRAGFSLSDAAAVAGLTPAALTAALPYLAQPARVVPSVEEVAWTLRDEMKRYMRSPVPLGDGRIGTLGATEYDLARAVIALFASQPTVADVREQVAREIEAWRGPAPDGDASDSVMVGHWVDSRDGEFAARIARGQS